MGRTLSFLVAAFSVVTLAVSAETARTTLTIEGMTCGGCVPTVKLQLKKTQGVLAYEVSFEKGEAQVSYDPAKTTPAKIAESVTRTGYTASVKASGGPSPAGGSPATAPTKGVSSHAEGALERVTFFQVPLMCPAVKGLGCGGKARPWHPRSLVRPVRPDHPVPRVPPAVRVPRRARDTGSCCARRVRGPSCCPGSPRASPSRC